MVTDKEKPDIERERTVTIEDYIHYEKPDLTDSNQCKCLREEGPHLRGGTSLDRVYLDGEVYLIDTFDLFDNGSGAEVDRAYRIIEHHSTLAEASPIRENKGLLKKIARQWAYQKDWLNQHEIEEDRNFTENFKKYLKRVGANWSQLEVDEAEEIRLNEEFGDPFANNEHDSYSRWNERREK